MSVLVLMIIFPIVGRYLRMMSGIMGGMYINESIKKMVTLILIAGIGMYISEIIYFGGFMYMAGGIIGRMLCGVYVFLLISTGMWSLLVAYLLPNVGINDNYRILTIRVLPLIAFFVKVCGFFTVMWLVIVNAMMILL